MSGGEEDAAVARLVRGRAEARRRKALLESELRFAGEAMADIGSGLKRVNGCGSLVLLCYKLNTLFLIFLAFSMVRR